MLTLSLARLFVSAAEPAWMVQNTVEAEPQANALARLLPAGLRRRLALLRRSRQPDPASLRPESPLPVLPDVPRLLNASPRRPGRVTLGTGGAIAPI